MAKLTEREVVILVKALGLDKAIAGFGTLDKSIKQTQKSSGELDRNMKGSANITSNTTKAFAKQAQGLGGLVHVYATVAANVFALSSAFNVLKSNADLKIMEQASRQLSVASGTNFNLVAKSLKDITGGAISMKEAMQTATLGLRGGATSAQLQQITEVATKAAKALGRSVPEAVTRLTQAVIKGEPELADEFGIILRVEEATKKYAATLGKTVGAMTTFERQQAIINQAIEQGVKKYGMLELDTNPYDKLAAVFNELTQKILQFVSMPIGAFLGALANNTNLLVAAILMFAKAVAARAIPEVLNLADAMLNKATKASQSIIASMQVQQKEINATKEKIILYSNSLKTLALNANAAFKEINMQFAKNSNIGKAMAEGIVKNSKGFAEAVYKTFYRAIDYQLRKNGDNIGQLMVDRLKKPMEKQFATLMQAALNVRNIAKSQGLAVDQQQILGKLGASDITYEQFHRLELLMRSYTEKVVRAKVAVQDLNQVQNGSRSVFQMVGGAYNSVKLSLQNATMSMHAYRVVMNNTLILQREGALAGLNFARAIKVVQERMVELGLAIDITNSKLNRFAVGMGLFGGKIAGALEKITMWVGRLFNAFIMWTIVVEIGKFLLDVTGAINKETEALATTVADLNKQYETTQESIASYNEELAKSSKETRTLAEESKRLEKLGNIYGSLATNSREFAKSARDAAAKGGEGWLSGIFGKTDLAKEMGKNLIGQISELKKLVGFEMSNLFKDVKLVIPTDFFDKYFAPLRGIVGHSFQDIMTEAFKTVPQMVDKVGNISDAYVDKVYQLAKATDSYATITKDRVRELLTALQQAVPLIDEARRKEIEAAGGVEKWLTNLASAGKITKEIGQLMGLSGEQIARVMQNSSDKTANYNSAINDTKNALDQMAKDFAGEKNPFKILTETKAEEGIAKIHAGLDTLNTKFKSIQSTSKQAGQELINLNNVLGENVYLLEILGEGASNLQTIPEALNAIATASQKWTTTIQELMIADSEIAAKTLELQTLRDKYSRLDVDTMEEKLKVGGDIATKEKEINDIKIRELEIMGQILALQYAINSAKIQQEMLDIDSADVAQHQLLIDKQRLLDLQFELQKKSNENQVAGFKAANKGIDDNWIIEQGNLHEKVAKAAESAAKEAQAQAEKIANLEASIAKKRLDRAAMFLALEKELGDAVESRMEWELTGAREAVALGNKRVALLGKELSMAAGMVELKKSVMEAEAHALEVKALGLEKDGELLAAEEARMEVANKRQEMNNLDIEYITLRLEYEQKLYDIMIKQHEARKRAMIPTFKEGSGIQGSEEFFQTAKTEFTLRWDKFLNEMTSPVDRLLDAFEGAVNSGVDAFVEAIANGENALEAAGAAIKQTMFELAKEWLKEDIKSLIYSTVGKALGIEDPKDALKNELQKMMTADTTRHNEIKGLMAQDSAKFQEMINVLYSINSKTGMQQAGGVPGIGNLFGMNQQQFGNVSAGLESLFDQRPDLFGSGAGLSGQLESLFDQRPDLFGSGAGLSGQLDSLFASQPDIFGSTTPGYASAFGGQSSGFGLGGLGTSLMNMFGTMPTPSTQPIGSTDIASGLSNPLSMSQGSMMGMMGGMGGMFGPNSALTTGMASIGQSITPPMGTMTQPTGMMQSGMGGVPQMSMGGMGGLGMGLNMSSMMMSMLPMLMGGIGGGSPAGQAAKEKSSSDSALGEAGGEGLEDLKDETEELKELSDRLLTEIKDHVLEIKINAIDFQIEHMEKIDKNFKVWLATFIMAQLQNKMLLTMMLGQLQQINIQLIQANTSLRQIAGCTCNTGMGMACGGVVSGLVRGYAKGAITAGPELAMIGEGTRREAIVPLPDNRSIPVMFTNKEEKEANSLEAAPINITINGVEGTEKGLKRSTAQIAYAVDRARRNKLMRY